ncbi:MAG TPA: hypothetical protein VGO61_17095, partial [Steroidobacteraceae bacterium]|nr:hypothetical protein [Steroidobacteraceae bacterium]
MTEQQRELRQDFLNVDLIALESSQDRCDHRVGAERCAGLVEVERFAACHRLRYCGVRGGVDLHAIRDVVIRIERGQQAYDVTEMLLAVRGLNFSEVIQREGEGAIRDEGGGGAAEHHFVRTFTYEEIDTPALRDLERAGGIGLA